MEEMRENGLRHGGTADAIITPDVVLSEDVNGGSMELKGLPSRIIRPLKFRNSPIIHRRSRMEEILCIPDVAAALTDSNDNENSVALKLRSKDQKIAARPPSPAYLGPPLPESAAEEQSASGHFHFDFENTATSESNASTPEDQDLGDTQAALAAVGKQEKSDQSDPESGMIYDAISDSLVPLKTAHSADGETTMVGRRLSTTSSILMGMQQDQEQQAVAIQPPDSPSAKGNKTLSLSPVGDDEESYVEDYFNTYNRPSIKERRRLQRIGLLKESDEQEQPGQTWKSLARAIARVQASTPDGEQHTILNAESEITPILKSTDPASKSTLRKKTVSFSRLPSESPIRNAADCVNMMQMGHQFVKMRSNARIYNRYYWFDLPSSSLRWEPSKKDAGKAKIDISSIKEVRPGKATELFLSSEISSHFPEECAFSIIYSDYKNLDLIAGSVDEANIWITGLRCLIGGQDPEELQTRRDTRDTWLSSVFESADTNKDGHLDEEESLVLLKSLSDGIRETRIKQKLTEFLRFKDRDRTRLTKDEFVELFKDVTTRPEIYFLLARHASRDDRLSVDDLMLFLESEQGLPGVTREKCIELIEQYEPSLELKAIPAFGIDGFTKYLMSRECNIFNPTHSQVCQDMDQPLSHYYIASSHNTYLMEDQLSGPSNVSAYMRSLLRCCRCIELDCWNGTEGPMICHGHTPSNGISFQQTIEAIKECSFKNSPYPVILCIENHCSVEQQKVMASILITILGDQIYTTSPDEKSEYLPSPEALKYKFLIRGKKLHPEEEAEGYVTDEDEGAAIKETGQISPNQLGGFTIGPGVSNTKKDNNSEEERPKRKLVKELSDLISLCVSVRMSDNEFLFSHGKSRRYYELTSMHERTATNLAQLSPEEFVNFNKKFLTRVYPSATRVDSSNFNPQDFWNCGVQIASLNYQTPGLMMDINDGRFSLNGGCGYVLKPTIMRDEVAYFSAQQNDVIPSITPKILHLRVISGQEFPKPRGGGAKGHVIDPYVLIELFGMPSDCVERRTRTSHDCGSGNSTALFDETFEFRLTVPDLALVRFVVLDDDFIGDEFIGQYTIPFECLQSGYRHLRLRSIFDEPLDDATLFVHIAVTEAVPQLSHTSSAPLLPVSVNSPNSVAQQNSQSSSSKKLSKRSSSSSVLMKKSKKAIQQQQARRERAAAMRAVGVKKVDEIFQTASPALRDAGEMRENLHISLSFFKEVCGVSSLSSVKQCIRSLTHRVNIESQQGIGRKLSRKISNDPSSPSPQNGVSAPSTPKLREKTNLAKANSVKGSLESLNLRTDSSGKLSLKMVLNEDDNPSLEIYNVSVLPPSSGDVWRKVLGGFNALVNDAKYVIDNAAKCHGQLSLIHKEALTYHESLPSLLSEANATSDSSQSIAAPAGKKQKKKNQKEKGTKQNVSAKKLEWDFSWNCSVIQGHLYSLESVQKEAKSVLSHLREAGVTSGLICDDDRNKVSSQKLKKSYSKLSNCSDGSRDSALPERADDNASIASDSSSLHSKPEDREATSTDDVTESKNSNSNNNTSFTTRKQAHHGEVSNTNQNGTDTNVKQVAPGSRDRALSPDGSNREVFENSRSGQISPSPQVDGTVTRFTIL